MLNQPLDCEKFFKELRDRLAFELPGEAAQNRMTARARISTAEYLRQNPHYRKSAVLLLVYPYEETVYTLLIRRPSYDGTHSGQLALPGGKVEEDDSTLIHTAIRETMEEVGVDVPEKNILGSLSPVYIPVSNYLVQPFVAQLPERPSWNPDHREVDALLEIPLTRLLDPQIKSRRRIPVGKNMFVDAPCYILNDQILWGATAMMFSELEELIAGFQKK
ncbi:MAG TPA: CoA pyrophosphatase [Bacteroidia bacterium]|nr:CoA pyrophosphatase [Bacteroidia bacterium]